MSDARSSSGELSAHGLRRFVPADTDPEAHDFQTEIYRRMSGPERVAIAMQLTETVRQTALAGIRSRHPEYDEDQVRQAFFRVWLGDPLTLEVWPDRPLVDP